MNPKYTTNKENRRKCRGIPCGCPEPANCRGIPCGCPEPANCWGIPCGCPGRLGHDNSDTSSASTVCANTIRDNSTNAKGYKSQNSISGSAASGCSNPGPK